MRDMGRRRYLESDVGGADCRHRLFSSLPLPSPPSGARTAAPLRSSLSLSLSLSLSSFGFSRRQASRCPVRCNCDAPVWVRPVSSSRVGLGPLPCRARLRLVRRPLTSRYLPRLSHGRPFPIGRRTPAQENEPDLYIHRTVTRHGRFTTRRRTPGSRSTPAAAESGKKPRDRGSRCSSS
jgi:hypothetical protein